MALQLRYGFSAAGELVRSGEKVFFGVFAGVAAAEDHGKGDAGGEGRSGGDKDDRAAPGDAAAA